MLVVLGAGAYLRSAGEGRDPGGRVPSLIYIAEPAPPRVTGRRKSTVGRPRALTDAQVRIILVEHAKFTAWRLLRQNLKSQRQLAREFGVSQGTISYAIRSQGQYKQAAPASGLTVSGRTR